MPGTVLTVGILACTTALAAGLCGVGAAAVVGQRSAAAADAAALAAADTVIGAAIGDPCARAAELAAAHGASLETCDIAGMIATVGVSLPFGPLRSTAAARAGPPP